VASALSTPTLRLVRGELASDTRIDRVSSQRAHKALGFEAVDRCVHFKKALATPHG
jgi:hypothetical protein